MLYCRLHPLTLQDAVYIDLAGSHAHEGANELVMSLMGARHPLDTKMRQAEVAIFKVRSTLF